MISMPPGKKTRPSSGFADGVSFLKNKYLNDKGDFRMKNHVICIFLLAFLAVPLFLVRPAEAQDIKARMKARLPVIIELKSKGIVGENNKGFLEFVGGQHEKADVVQAENSDRAQVYEAIAKQQGVTPELVGKRRAAQLRDLAKPGEWLQNENGQWYQK